MVSATAKQPRDRADSDILYLVNSAVKETIHLDYKQSASLQNTNGRTREINKNVSEFVNAGKHPCPPPWRASSSIA